MATITLKQAALWCGGFVEEKYENVQFLGANNDTRILKQGQLFIVLQGARDGHDFIPAAMEKGAAAVLCSRKVGDYPAIYVDDPRTALGDIAREALKALNCKVVGVTGSVGKSTTKEMIAAVLESTWRVSKTPANHNNDIGMPMAILAMPEDTQIAVLEMGMNHFREIAYLSQIARPDVAVIINIGTMHIEYLGSREGIRTAKLEIVEGMPAGGRLILNGDDSKLFGYPVSSVEITYFGSNNEACQVFGRDVMQTPEGIEFNVNGQIPVQLALEGMHFVSDALAAVAVGMEMGVPAEKISSGLADFRNMEGRQEIFKAGEYTIIKDCYNAGPESMAAALAVLNQKPGRHVAVLGDMLELGVCTQAEHYKLGRIVAENADVLLAYGPNSVRVLNGARSGGMPDTKARAFTDRDRLADVLRQMVKPGDVILFKGSRGMRMELILDRFLQKEE